MLDALRRRLPGPPAGETWIGDDAAVVRGPKGGWLLLAADVVVAGVHADLSVVGLDDVGWKALTVNLSDVAAMGGRPGHALVSIAAPASGDVDLLYDGLAAAATEYECPVVGGDLSTAPTLVVSVAVTGTVDGAGARGRRARPVLRSGARPGDTLFVTGPLGASAAGLWLLRDGRPAASPRLVEAHRRPRPRLGEGEAARRAGATAMIDVSDGLATDVRHLADASGVGVVVEHVPVDDDATEEVGDAVALALGGGEDYELLFTAPSVDEVEASFAAAGLRAPVVIGRCTADPDERRLGNGRLSHAGWEHQW